MVVFTVRVELTVPLAEGVTDDGAREQVTVASTGAIEQVNATAELKLLRDATVMVEAVGLPATVKADAGDAVTLKSVTDRT